MIVYTGNQLKEMGQLAGKGKITGDLYTELKQMHILLRTKRGKRKRKSRVATDTTAPIAPQEGNGQKDENEPQLNIHVLNCRSLNMEKAEIIVRELFDKDVDLFLFTETWFKTDQDDPVTGMLKQDGYNLISVARKDRPGGGVAIVHKTSLRFSVPPPQKYISFEYKEILLETVSECVRLCVLYRPPNGSVPQFLDEFTRYIDGHTTTSGKLVIAGDFNFHWGDNKDPTACRFMETVKSLGLDQWVTEPTHTYRDELKNTLDLVITRAADIEMINDLTVSPTPKEFSDHCLISFKLPIQKPITRKTRITVRDIKNINMEEFVVDIEQSTLFTNTPTDLDDLIQSYNTTLLQILDKHAPATTKEVIVRPHTPWFSGVIRKAKKDRRKAERKWKKSKLKSDRDALKERQKTFNDLCRDAKLAYYSNIIKKPDRNSKELFQVANTLLCRRKTDILPSYSREESMAEDFCTFFKGKIVKIRDTFSGGNSPQEGGDTHEDLSGQEDGRSHEESLDDFAEISQEQLSGLINKSSSASCNLDPMPTSLIKSLLPTILPIIQSIVNKSLTEHKMPATLKEALVKPLIKKTSLDKEDLKNYRPVSNLPFIGKVIEKAAIQQMNEHITTNNLYEPLQSAYTSNHSTETALLKVSDDILSALDNGKCVFMVLLDLSAAFDTIDHSVFLARMKEDYAMSGGVAGWMQSYLSNRHQSISINGTLSNKTSLDFGLPQGSAIGPFGFKLYTKPLTAIARKHNIQIHLYADDTQLYVSCDPKQSTEALDRLEACIEDIKDWMGKNFLKLNDAKTELIIFGTKENKKRMSEFLVEVGDSTIWPSKTVRNIGGTFDPTFKMEAHIVNVQRSCYIQLRALHKIRQYLTREAAEKLTHAFVTSRLDNLNSLLVRMPAYQIQKLQLIQNQAARIVTEQRRSCHITPILKDLHWLPVTARIDFKVLLQVYKCLHGTAPDYLASKLRKYECPRDNMRSASDTFKLDQPSYELKKFGFRSFSVAAPCIWNELPRVIRHSPSVNLFKQALKTHLFRREFFPRRS